MLEGSKKAAIRCSRDACDVRDNTTIINSQNSLIENLRYFSSRYICRETACLLGSYASRNAGHSLAEHVLMSEAAALLSFSEIILNSET